MTVTVRPGVPDDAQAVAEVNVTTWRAAFRGVVPDGYLDTLTAERRTEAFRETLAGRSPPGARTTVAEQNGQIVGFVCWGASRDDDAAEGTGEIYAIYVLPECWGTGIGRALMAEAIAALARCGYARVTLWTLAEVPRTRRFYATAGFAPDGATKVVARGDLQSTHVRLATAIAGIPKGRDRNRDGGGT